MIRRDQETVLRLIQGAVNSADLDLLEQLVHPDFFSHWAAPSRASGPSGLRETIEQLHTAFSGFRIDPKDVIAEEGKVVVRATASGRRVGDHAGVRATWRDWSAEEIHIFRLSGGKVVEHWAACDDRGALRQPAMSPSALRLNVKP